MEILEVPNSGGNHSSPFITENSDYIVAGTRFSIPMDDQPDVPIETYKQNFRGTASFISVHPQSGELDLAFQVLLPGVNLDLSRSGKGLRENCLAQRPGPREVCINLGLDFANDGKAAVDLGNDALLLMNGRYRDR